MLLTVFPLLRDPATRHHTYGYCCPSRHHFRPTFFTPELGGQLHRSDGASFEIPLVKMVEYYQSNDEHNYSGPIILERLAWKNQSNLYIYRLKYIRPVSVNINDPNLLILPNLNTIHSKITNTGVMFTSPFTYQINNMPRSISNPEGMHYITDIYRRDLRMLDVLVRQHGSWDSSNAIFDRIDQFYPWCEIEEYLESKILPRLPVLDPLTGHIWKAPLAMRDLIHETHEGSPFDVTAPAPLDVPAADIMLFSPKEFHDIAIYFETMHMEYTDIKIEYILSGRKSVSDLRLHYAISRYHVRPSLAELHRKLTFIALASEAIADELYDKIASKMCLRIILTLNYNEEAMVEIYDGTSAHCLLAVHLDLAMLALTTGSVVQEIVPY